MEFMIIWTNVPELQLESANDDAEPEAAAADEAVAASPAESPDSETTATLH